MSEDLDFTNITHFEWDDDKNIINLEKHGLDFETAAKVFIGPFLIKEDVRRYSEKRYVAIGVVLDVAIQVVFTIREGQSVRIISAWNGGRNARKKYRTALNL